MILTTSKKADHLKSFDLRWSAFFTSILYITTILTEFSQRPEQFPHYPDKEVIIIQVNGKEGMRDESYIGRKMQAVDDTKKI